jgi:hypothetical protein
MNNIHRNLGYYNPLQTDLANYFKSKVIDWILNKKNQNELLDELVPIININKEVIIDEIKQYFAKSDGILKAYIIDLYILSKINNITIILYDMFENIIAILNNGIKYIINNNKFNKIPEYDEPCIKIKYNINNFTLNSNPTIISAIYN